MTRRAPAASERGRVYAMRILALCVAGLSLAWHVGVVPKTRIQLSLEAEDFASVQPPMVFVEDRLASGFRALEIPLGAGKGFWQQAAGSAEAGVTIPRDGDYWIWLRVNWKGGCENAVYLQVDNGRRVVAGNDAVFDQWHWVKAGPFVLDGGPHRLKLSNHSHGIKIDKLEIVNDPQYEPWGYGEDISAFFDGFGGCDGQNIGSWRLVSGEWRAVEDSPNNPLATSSTLAQTSRGEALALAQQVRFREGEMEVYVMSVGQGDVGVVFSYVDAENYNRLEWRHRDTGGTNALRVVSVQGGARRILGSGGKGYRNDIWQVLSLKGVSNRVDVSVDGVPALAGVRVPLLEGTAGLYTRDNACAYFDNVKILVRREGAHTPASNTGSDVTEWVREEDIQGRRYTVEKVRIGKTRIPAFLVYDRTVRGRYGPALIEWHGWGGRKRLERRRRSPRPAQRGYVEVHPDLRGHGERQEVGFEARCRDNFPMTSMYVLSRSSEDVVSLLDYLERRKDLGVTRTGVVGYSMGGAVAVLSMTLDRRVDAGASVNAWVCNYWGGATNTTYAALQGWQTDVDRQVNEPLKAEYVKYDPLWHPDAFLRRPLLMVGNRNDRLVNPSSMVMLHERLVKEYGKDSNKVQLKLHSPAGRDNHDVMLSHLPDLDRLPEVDAWLDRYLCERGTSGARAKSAGRDNRP